MITNEEFEAKIEELEREVFDKNSDYLREKSRAEGIQKKLQRNVEFELLSIEDILDFMNSENVEVARKAIEEQIRRIRKVFEED